MLPRAAGADVWPRTLDHVCAGRHNVYELDWDGVPTEQGGKCYGDIFLQAEQAHSEYNFKHANTDALFEQFIEAEARCNALLGLEKPLPLPAYDQCMKASHLFNLLDARGVISVTERQGYIGRVRALAKDALRLGTHHPAAREFSLPPMSKRRHKS